MIKTRFEPKDRGREPYPAFERDMPYPPSVGDEVEFEASGRNFRVTSVAWILPDSDDHTAQISLIVGLA